MSPGIGMKILGQKDEDKEASEKRQEARAGAYSAASLAELQAQLADSEKEYHGLPSSLLKQYTENARRAGTFANTDEFNTGLQSDVQGGLRGARISQAARINALRTRLGMTPFDSSGQASPGAAVKDATTESYVEGSPASDGMVSPAPVTSATDGDTVDAEPQDTSMSAIERLKQQKLASYRNG